MQRIRDGRMGRVLGGRAIKRSRGVRCCLHRVRGDEEREFFGGASKSRSMVYPWFGLKTTGTIFHRFGPQNQ
jgi:hypothetical protein